MNIRLFNTLTSQKELLTPLEPGRFRMYVCGPTVYDLSHLGHARCYVVYDVLARHLRARGLEVTYVRNVTDIDDKILNRARDKGEDPLELAQRMTEAYHADMAALGNLPPDREPRVSEHLDEIRALISRLIEAKMAYVSGGDVYYDVPAFKSYGKLSHRKVEDLEAGASGRTDEEEAARKRHPHDFALWKGASEGELSWPSPWGPGRPGWHIECSAMSMKHLGDSFDLHGGGLDLVFPHHENEIAQSEGATGCTMARLWMHNGFVQVNKEKMSKSLGNFFGCRDVFAKVEAEAVRLGMFTVHYRSPLNLDWTQDETGKVTGFPLFEEAERRLEYLYETQLRLASLPEKRLGGKAETPPADLAAFTERLADSLDDDLNMPVALAHMIDFLRAVNELCDRALGKGGQVPKAWVDLAQAGFAALDRHLGIGAQVPEALLLRVRDRRAHARGLDPAWVEGRITARTQARAAKDFALSDQLRDELAAQGVKLFDGTSGTTWKLG
ncbi:MAG: cysteine--tRNA ligase [Myxococcales bacterium]|nr:cysteine--tRNA ligase [Myxococcales bacterium]